MSLVYFHMTEQYCKKYSAKATYFLYYGLSVTLLTIYIQFSKNIYLSVRWMTLA